jgi:hypothetical protein
MKTNLETPKSNLTQAQTKHFNGDNSNIPYDLGDLKMKITKHIVAIPIYWGSALAKPR